MLLVGQRHSEGEQAEADGRRLSQIAATRFDIDRGEAFDRHDHPEHQLVWASRGVALVDVHDERWVLAPTQALWIPADVPHLVGAGRDALLHCHYFWPGYCPIAWAAPTVVRVTPLIAQLLVLLNSETPSVETLTRAEGLLFDMLEPTSSSSLPLPSPRDGRAMDVAAALAANPADDRTLEAWGRAIGASERTLARLFVNETGLTFAEWRTRLRLRAALGHLAAGVPVKNVAALVGYASPSAFVAVFQRTLGCTPASLGRGAA